MPSALPVDLADGQNTSVPFMQSSDIGDNELLNATRTIETGSGYYFEITLPGGRRIESAPCGSDYPKRDAIMQWLGAIREAIVEDAANAGRAARDAQLAEPPRESSSERPAQPLSRSERTADPVEYAREQLRAAVERLAALSDAEALVAKWRRVLVSLTGEGAPKNRRKRRKKKKKHVIQPQ